MSVELHLPDLPEVPISVGRPARRVRVPWHRRLREALVAYLPLLLMGLLALASWWLVKNSPRPLAPQEERPVSSEPDYTMSQFALERFDAAGKLKLRIEGAQLRHYPDTDRVEIDQAQIRAIAPDGRVTLAQARRAVGNGDGSEVQLLGGAQVTSTDAHGAPVLMRGEFLHAFLVSEKVKSHLPVWVTVGGSDLRAAGLDYDHATRRLDLKGPLREPATEGGTVNAPLVFITGASSGIGQALAARYAAAGWRLALVARRGAEIESWLQAQGLGAERAAVYPADVSDTDSIIAAAQACIERQGLPDVVIANAGISVGMDTAEREDLNVMRDTFATNNLGLAATFHPFLRRMRQRGSGTLVGIASVAAIRGLPGHGAYCASKAAVVAYCESLRGECRRQGVKVVTLLPGYIATPLTARNPYSMPFLMAPERFADRAFRAIEAGASYRVIPWQMAIVARLMRALPNAWFDRLAAGRGRKPRRS